MSTETETILTRIDALRESAGMSERALSIEVTGRPDFIRDLKRRKHTPKGDNLDQLASVLGTTTDYLLGRTTSPEAIDSEVSLSEKRIDWNGQNPEEEGIPIVGTGDCADLEVIDTETGNEVSVERSSFDPEYHIRYFSRPPALRGARELYAIYYHGQSMEPRFEAGEVGIVDPKRPARPGDYVVVQLNNGSEEDVVSVLCKRLVSQSAREITLEQFNPPLVFTIPKGKVARIHRIMPQTDLLFG